MLNVLMLKNKTNHPISSNNHPSASANKAIYSLKIGGLQNDLMLSPISPELVLFPDFWDSNIPRFFCFIFYNDKYRILHMLINVFPLFYQDVQVQKGDMETNAYPYAKIA